VEEEVVIEEYLQVKLVELVAQEDLEKINLQLLLIQHHL
jgi:hypothetical protein